MAYFGCQFVFDDIPSWEYGLVIYDFGEINEDGSFSSMPKIVEDRISRRSTPLHYGVTRNEPLKYKLYFGADPRTIEQNQWLDRWEIDAIASWLTEHDDYKYLEIFQQDLDAIRYKCIITDLTYSSYGKYPWAFTCEVTCDGPYAYLTPETFPCGFSTGSDIPWAEESFELDCRASPMYYRPKLQIEASNISKLVITNHSDGDRAFELDGLAGSDLQITVDNENEILSNNKNLNLYTKFNLNFFRLVRGINDISVRIYRNSRPFSVAVDFICEFPINVGG